MRLTSKIFLTSLGVLGIIGCTQLIKKSSLGYYDLSGKRLDRSPASLSDEVRRLDPKKKTVCTLTINSDDEKEVFRKHLGPQNFNFIELTNFEGRRNNWFLNACRSGVQCDIVLISGHFGGQFFGSSGLFLPLEDLESYACQSECDGILKKPQEVFLFGCNTLVGKKKDHRTQAEYVRVLMDDGFSRADAERVAAFRYSPLGHTNESRMRRAFKGARKLYGFDAVAPSGANIRGSLDSYLKKVGDYNNHLRSLSPQKKNEDLATVLKWAPFVELEGWGDVSQSTTCYLENQQIEDIEKLRWIKKTFSNSQEGLQNANFIHQYMSRQQEVGTVWTESQNKVLEEIRENTETKNTIEKMLEGKVLGLLSVETSMASLMRQFGWWDLARFNVWADQSLGRYFNGNIKREQIDDICSSGISLDFVPTQLPQNSLNWNSSILEVVSCLRPSHPTVADQLLEIAKKHPEAQYRSMAIRGLHDISQRNSNVRTELLAALEVEPNDRVIDQIENVLRESKKIDASQLVRLKKIIATPQSFQRPLAALNIIRASKSSDSSLPSFLIQIMLSKESGIHGLTKLKAADALAELPSVDTSTIDQLIAIVGSRAPYDIKYGAANIINKARQLTEDQQQRLVTLIQTDVEMTTRIGAASALENATPLNASLKSQLEQALNSETESVVRQRITNLLQATKY